MAELIDILKTSFMFGTMLFLLGVGMWNAHKHFKIFNFFSKLILHFFPMLNIEKEVIKQHGNTKQGDTESGESPGGSDPGQDSGEVETTGNTEGEGDRTRYCGRAGEEDSTTTTEDN